MSVEPFPITRCLHHIEMMRAHLDVEPTAGCRRALLRQFVEQHRKFLADSGVESRLIDREVHYLRAALSPAPTAPSGMRLAA